MNPKSLDISIGSSITYQGTEYIVRGRPDVGILFLHSDSGGSQKVSISTLLASIDNTENKRNIPAIDNLDDAAWNLVVEKRNIISRVFENGESAIKVAEEVGMHYTHIYNLRDKFEKFGIEGLVKISPTGGAGKLTCPS